MKFTQKDLHNTKNILLLRLQRQFEQQEQREQQKVFDTSETEAELNFLFFNQSVQESTPKKQTRLNLYDRRRRR